MSRDSYVKIRSGSPLASDLERLADDISEFGQVDVPAGLSTARIVSRLDMMEERVRRLVKVAEALEECGRMTLEARNG